VPRLRATLGLEAPIEVAFMAPEQLERMTPRPATLDLPRRLVQLAGDDVWRSRFPRFQPSDVPLEEVRLLVENRGFELLDALARRRRPGELEALRRRHAVLKTVLELATAHGFLTGDHAESAEERVARARAKDRAFDASPWSEALAWRSGAIAAVPADLEADEWDRAARAWCAAWRRAHGAAAGDDAASLVRHAGARAPWRSRIRQALSFHSGSGRVPALGARLLHAPRGTPQHRLNASAAAVLLAAGERGSAAASLPANLRALGVIPADLDGEAAAARLVRCWDTWILDGQRTDGGE
jgi:hypothetical protein